MFNRKLQGLVFFVIALSSMHNLNLQGNLRLYGITNINHDEAQTTILNYRSLNKQAATAMIIVRFPSTMSESDFEDYTTEMKHANNTFDLAVQRPNHDSFRIVQA